MLNKNLQEINIQNMDTELVAQMFKNYQSNVLFHLEGMCHATPEARNQTANEFQRPTVSRILPEPEAEAERWRSLHL